MSELPEIGKISPEIFNELIYPRLGAKSEAVLVGPQHGVDVGIVEIGDKVVALTTDPVFIVPEYGWERAAWFAVHILVSDAVTCGLKPEFLSIDLNLPMEMTKEQLEIMWNTIHQECDKLGISIICGHTARYENCHYPMVGGATVISVGEKDEYVTPKLARVGDKIIITKGPAIEATGIFATMFPKLIEERFGFEFSQKAQQIFYKMSVVEDALTAVSVGVREEGVSAMHDATECGIWGGLYEIAQAAGLGTQIEKERIVMEDCVQEICEVFGIDPYVSISEGTLIIACREHKAPEVVKALSQKGIKSSVVGELTKPEEGMVLIERGKEKRLKHPIVDPFWKAFYSALKKVKKS
ncbi:MAG: AIR synthase [Chloroflexi bacterium CG_4_10_14_0_8_um_filter_46_9]|nr:MAG: AIR synthase [Dehalococcoidia bacterium CG2_30_46_19]PIW40724.1 MAG: AIR synthase [Chloroflexi bacterium CG15_BIG_FIL_POST_REV_8_21_14_020_46_15]PIZ27106.1 MAG: AIR synthase [Chloroflexi bacterium CG_4_10_14_0_8_um_filter_46_9]